MFVMQSRLKGSEMVTNEDQLKEVKKYFGEVAVAKEGGIEYVLIKNAPMPLGCTPNHTDVLLCTGPRDGYPSRLFFAQKVEGLGTRNWHPTTFFILNQNWFAFSLNFTHTSDLTLAQAIQTHLSAFREGFHP